MQTYSNEPAQFERLVIVPGVPLAGDYATMQQFHVVVLPLPLHHD
jgi:hypothetical protein